MLTLSRAIEDEIASRADQPILIGAFQHERFWRASEDRWRNLAPTTKATVVLATLPRRRHRDHLWEVPIDPTTQLPRRGSWDVVAHQRGLVLRCQHEIAAGFQQT